MLGDAQAVPVLLRMLAFYEVIDGYHQAAEDALVALGDPAIEACLEVYPTANNEDLRSGIVAVLSRSPEKHERIFQTLWRSLSSQRNSGPSIWRTTVTHKPFRCSLRCLTPCPLTIKVTL